MVKWYKNLYVGDNAKKEERRIRRKIEKGRIIPGIFLITYASNPDNQLDIIPSALLKQKTVYQRCPMIIGIASGYEEALEIVSGLADQAYRQEEAESIRSYLKQHE